MLDKYKINKKSVLLSVLLAGAIFYGGYFSNGLISNKCNREGFAFINAELVCRDKLVINKSNYGKLKSDLVSFISKQKRDNNVTNISIYFRDLKYGPTLGIGEYDLFSPASLLKLPLFMTYESLKEDGLVDFSKKIIAYSDYGEYDQLVEPKESVRLGQEYSIQTLLEYMIKYSDNNAYGALLHYLYIISPEKDLLKDTFVDLGIIDPKDLLENTISVKSYSSIFVQLYNASYFNKKESSEEALSLLVDVDWKDGINWGVPEYIKVAHKFGERSNLEGGVSQLHDCGIVYYPGNPYLLCVMTRGKYSGNLPRVIGLISKMFYDEVKYRDLQQE